MIQKFVRAVVLAGCALAEVNPLCAQRGADWMTIGNDGQRSSWVRSDAKISADTMRKPGFELVWKLKLKNEARQLNSLTPPALFEFYIGYRGFRSLGFVGGSSNKVIAIDVDLARVEWEKNLAPGSPDAASILCPGGMTSSVTRPTLAAYPAAGSHGSGRDSPAKSGVGEPFEGAVTLKEREMRCGCSASAHHGADRPPNCASAGPLRPHCTVRARRHRRRQVSFALRIER